MIGQLAEGLGLAGSLLAGLALTLAASLLLALGIAARDACLQFRAFGTPVLLSRYSRTVWVTTMGAVAGVALTLLASPAPDVLCKTF